MKYGKAADKSAKIRCLKRNKCTVQPPFFQSFLCRNSLKPTIFCLKWAFDMQKQANLKKVLRTFCET